MAEVQTEHASLHHIIVRQDEHIQKWWPELRPKLKYKFTHLKEDTLYKDSHNVVVYQSRRHSELSLLGEFEAKDANHIIDNEKVISYQGVITSVIDDLLGLYELDKKIVLCVSYTLGVANGLHNLLVTNNSKKRKCHSSFDVGQYIAVYNAHLDNTENLLWLICCSRSCIKFIDDNNLVADMSNCRNSQNVFLDWVHSWNAGKRSVVWLHQLKQKIMFALNESSYKTLSPCIAKVIKTVTEKKCVEKHSRSVVEEFIVKGHPCVTQKSFEDPVNFVEDLHSKIRLKQETTSFYPNYNIIKNEDHNWAIIGQLRPIRASYFELTYGRKASINVITVGCDSDLNKCERPILLVNFDLVAENFYLENSEASMTYLIVNWQHIVSLLPNTTIDKFPDNTNRFEIYIKSKTCIVCCCRSCKGCCFYVIADITNSESSERSCKIIAFKDNLCKLYSIILEGCTLHTMMFAESLYKISCPYFLKELNKSCAQLPCISLPCDFRIERITHGTKKTHLIEELTNVEKDSYIDIEGIVVHKKYSESTLPLFSQNTTQEAQLWTCPQSNSNRTLRIIIRGVRINSDNEIPVYMKHFDVTKTHQLGLLPGIKVRLTWLKKKVSKHQRIYLYTTKLTNLTILCNTKDDIEIPNISCHKFIHQIVLHSRFAFTLIATVSRIMSVKIFLQCETCATQLECGSCPYQGCHGDGREVAASAAIMVDDGTGCAKLFVNKVSLVKSILDVDGKQWQALLDYVYECHQLQYNGKYNSGNNDALGKSVVPISIPLIFEALCRSDKLLRPLRFSCRKFLTYDDETELKFYCINITFLVPDKDVKHFQ